MGSALDHHRAEWEKRVKADIESGANRIASARVVAEALNRGAAAERENAQLKQENRKMAAKLQFPYLQSVPEVLKKTQHKLEADAKAFHEKALALQERSGAVFDRAADHLPSQHLDDLSTHLDNAERALTGSNGGDPLDGTSETSSGS